MVKQSSKKNTNKRHDLGENPLYARVIITVVLSFASFVCLYPILNVLAKSLSEAHAIYTNPMMVWPESFTLEAYKYIFSTATLKNSFMVTVFTTVVGTAFNLFFTVTCAYSLSRIHVPGHKLMLWYVVIPMLFGAGLIPQYILIKNLHLIDSIWVLILSGLISPYNAILMRNFFWSIPDSLSESAKIDGANDIQVLCRIILPLSKPIIATIGLFHAVGHWNDYFTGLYFINDNSKWPLQVVLKSIIVDLTALNMGNLNYNTVNDAGKVTIQPDNIRAAVIIFATIPILLVYPFLQKYFTKGIIIGAVKE